MNVDQKITLFNLKRYKRHDDAKIVDHKEMFVVEILFNFVFYDI